MIDKFKPWLEKAELAKNTLQSYLWTVKHFLTNYGEPNKENLMAYKCYLMEHFKPQTVNLRLQGINKYLEFIRKDKLKMKFLKVQQKNFLENVISDADYKFLKRKLKSDGHTEWYFVVWFMGATGARISELLKIKAEHVEAGYLDLYSKGGKIRRLYIPKKLRNEANEWLKRKDRIHFQEPIRQSYFCSWYLAAVKALRQRIRNRPQGRVSALVPSSFCQEFPGKIQRHSSLGRSDGPREYRDHQNLLTKDSY